MDHIPRQVPISLLKKWVLAALSPVHLTCRQGPWPCAYLQLYAFIFFFLMCIYRMQTSSSWFPTFKSAWNIRMRWTLNNQLIRLTTQSYQRNLVIKVAVFHDLKKKIQFIAVPFLAWPVLKYDRHVIYIFSLLKIAFFFSVLTLKNICLLCKIPHDWY